MESNTQAIGPQDTWSARITRRAISISAIALALVVFVAAAPIAMPVAWIYDRLGGSSRRTVLRAYAFLLSFFALELVGIAASFVLWIARTLRTMDHAKYIDLHYRLQAWWANTLAQSAIKLFALNIEYESTYEFGKRPFVLFVRHVSFADTVLPMVRVAIPHGITLRYVLKRELLWDPCLDIVGQRLPNVFITRDPEQGGTDRALIQSLGEGLDAKKGIIIFPEGTRFSEKKRNRIIERGKQNGRSAISDEAERLTHILPARMGGMAAALDSNNEIDAVFCAHTGLENATQFRDLIDGALYGSRVAVSVWSTNADAIPKTEDGRRDWFIEQWRAVDAFITKEKESVHS